MILKYLILGAIIYGIYRFSNAKSLKSGSSTIIDETQKEDEYIDYEEIE